MWIVDSLVSIKNCLLFFSKFLNCSFDSLKDCLKIDFFIFVDCFVALTLFVRLAMTNPISVIARLAFRQVVAIYFDLWIASGKSLAMTQGLYCFARICDLPLNDDVGHRLLQFGHSPKSRNDKYSTLGMPFA